MSPLRLPNARVPVIGFAAYSGSGKTTLVTRVIPLLRERGLRLAAVKHAHHGFECDQPGKDSYQIRKAGANQTLVASGGLWALMTETPQGPTDPDLNELLRHLDQDHLDLILVEGFKWAEIPKIEVHRPRLGKPPLYPNDTEFVAVATDSDFDCPLPLLNLNDAAEVARFVVDFLGLGAPHD